MRCATHSHIVIVTDCFSVYVNTMLFVILVRYVLRKSTLTLYNLENLAEISIRLSLALGLIFDFTDKHVLHKQPCEE